VSAEAEDDDRLILAVAAGQPGALATLYERHGRAVWAVARAFARSEADVDDLVQETFLAALRSASTFVPGRASVRTWLFAIARNAARRTHRRTRDVADPPLLELGVAAGWGAPDAALARTSDASAIARAIAALEPHDREIVLLRDVERLSGEECAAALELSLPAMKSRLHRARLRLMASLRSDEGGVIAHERDVGGLTCGEVLARLGDYVDGELGELETAQVDAHLRECTVCERFGGRYAHVVHGARERLGAAHVVDAETFARVRRALAD
jgi:RNA polymerase sigma-70 factor (ECF subfamily)